nr:MAG TPA: IlvGEDA operon leader peptide [Caudoviricetes sp.]
MLNNFKLSLISFKRNRILVRSLSLIVSSPFVLIIPKEK